MIITVWNLAIAGGSAIGGLLLGTLGVAILPVVIKASVSTPALALTAFRQGFPRHGERALTPPYPPGLRGNDACPIPARGETAWISSLA